MAPQWDAPPTNTRRRDDISENMTSQNSAVMNPHSETAAHNADDHKEWMHEGL